MRAMVWTLALLLLACPLIAQETNPLSLEPGQRIRLNAPTKGDSWINARVLAIEPSSIAFTIDDQPPVVYTRAYSDIDMIDVRRHSLRRSAYDGALWGVYLGTAIGVISGPFAAKSLPIDTDTAILLFGTGGGLLGTAIGATTGAIISPGKWYRHVFR